MIRLTKLSKYLIMSSLIYSSSVLGNVELIIRNRPSIDRDYAQAISTIGEKYCKEYKIDDCNVIFAIMFIESTYRLGAIRQHQDYGIMQINKNNIRKMMLNKNKLVKDLDYSIEHGVKIFSWFDKTYKRDEAILRYNCGTRKRCVNWSGPKLYLKRVLKALEEK